MTTIQWREVSVVLLTVVLCLQEQEGSSSASTDEECKLVLALDTVQEFVCSAPAGDKYDIRWSVNGPLGEDAIAQFPEYLNVSYHESSNGTQQNKTLHFTAATPVNNTHLNCVVVNITTLSDPSSISILVFNTNITIQGFLGPPNEVKYERSVANHSVKYCWSAPFSLNISDTEPDILYYTVDVSDGAFNNNGVTTTETHYVLHADPCRSHMYRVKIAAVNVVGEGERYNSSEIDIEGYAVVRIMDCNCSFEEGLPVIKLSVETSPSCLDQEIVYQVKLNSIRSSNISCVNYTEPEEQVLKVTAPYIVENEHYNIEVSIAGISGSSSMPKNLKCNGIAVTQEFRVSLFGTCVVLAIMIQRGCW